MTLKELKNHKTIAIVGYGIEGKSTEKFLKRHTKARIIILDRSQGDKYLERQKEADLAIRSPGVRPELIRRPYTTATNIFFSNKKGVVIGVTGTKGKSTTASLIYEMLQQKYTDVRLIGNIGSCPLDLIETSTAETKWVMELSSYQLYDIQFSPEIALITNWYHEHTDFHGSEDAYKKAKQNIFRFQSETDTLIYDPNEIEIVNWVSQAHSQLIPYTTDFPFNHINIPLIGEHNKKNISAALTVSRLLQVSDSQTASALKIFKPLSHRLEYIGTYKEILFYDDAIATTPESTIYALDSLHLVDTVFLGGSDRGYNFEKLVFELEKKKISNIVLFPDSGKRIKDMLTKQKTHLPRILETTSMKEAVKFAFMFTKKGGICLLSTASPSYSLWKNFIEKGNQYKKFIHLLGV